MPNLHNLTIAQRVSTFRALALTIKPLFQAFLAGEGAAVRAHDGILNEVTANYAAKVVQGDDQLVIWQASWRRSGREG